MSKESSNNNSDSVGFLGLLTIVFIVLKLTNFINWSWWLVLAPTLIPIALVIVLIILATIIGIKEKNNK